MPKKLSDDVKARTNSGVSPELFLEHYGEFVRARRVLEEAQGVYRNVLKRAKNAGINQKQMLAAFQIKRREQEEVELEFRDLGRYLAWLGTPIGHQGSLFSASDDQKPSDRAMQQHKLLEIEQEGYDAGLHNQPIEACPYPQGSEFAAKWVEAWHGGRAFMERSGKKAEKTASPKRGRRGNPEDRAAV